MPQLSLVIFSETRALNIVKFFRRWNPFDWSDPEISFEKAIRSARWTLMAKIAQEHPEVAMKWRGWDPFEKTPIDALAFAVKLGMPGVVQGLLDAGFDPNIRGASGDCLLHHIARRADRDEFSRNRPYALCAGALASAGTDLNATNDAGFSAMAVAAKMRRELLRRGEVARSLAQENLILALASKGADPWVGDLGSRAADFLDANLLGKASSSNDFFALSPVGQIWAKKSDPLRL